MIPEKLYQLKEGDNALFTESMLISALAAMHPGKKINLNGFVPNLPTAKQAIKPINKTSNKGEDMTLRIPTQENKKTSITIDELKEKLKGAVPNFEKNDKPKLTEIRRFKKIEHANGLIVALANDETLWFYNTFEDNWILMKPLDLPLLPQKEI